MPKKYIIIGNSTAGLFAVEEIKKKDPAGKVTIISNEPYTAYSRVLLTNYIAGEIDYNKLFLVNEDYYNQNEINLLTGKEVVRIDPTKNEVELDNMEIYDYDSLLLATGSRPYYPNNLSKNVIDVLGLRNIEDAVYLREKALTGSKILILGGGPVGIKLACAFKKAGARPELLVNAPRVLSRVADDESAIMIQKRMLNHGITVRTGVTLDSLITVDSGIEGVKLVNAQIIDCDSLVICKGVYPNGELLRDNVSESGGIRVDEKMRTPVENIYAAGDVAETYDVAYCKYSLSANWPHAAMQGRIAGINMAGGDFNYRGSLSRNAMEVLGLPFVSMGVVNAPVLKEWDIFYEKGSNSYQKMIYRNGLLVGAILVGQVEDAGLIQAQIRRENTC